MVAKQLERYDMDSKHITPDFEYAANITANGSSGN